MSLVLGNNEDHSLRSQGLGVSVQGSEDLKFSTMKSSIDDASILGVIVCFGCLLSPQISHIYTLSTVKFSDL